jgi:acyl carrier protein
LLTVELGWFLKGNEMNKRTIEQRVISVIAEQLGVDKSEVTAEKDIETDLGADSLDQLETVMAIEEEFEIELSDAEAEQVRTVAEAIALVKRHATEMV